jgi:hypothetical protein
MNAGLSACAIVMSRSDSRIVMSWSDSRIGPKLTIRTDANKLILNPCIWEIHKELANLGGVTVDPLTPAKIDRPSDLQRIDLRDYTPQEYESPCQTLDQLHSYRLSVPVTEPVETGTPLFQYQSIDKLIPHLKHYKCHLKDKAKFKQLQNDENNIVAASWPFHQQLDGLNVEEGMPLLAMSVKEASSCRSATHANRYPVTLSIRFFFPELAASFAAQEFARKGNDDTWETIVYVQDKSTFSECVEWKFQDTISQWEAHRAMFQCHHPLHDRVD